MRVVLTDNWRSFRKGAILTVTDGQADLLRRRGIAVPCEEGVVETTSACAPEAAVRRPGRPRTRV